ncbi:MAG: hypothetical protein LUD84_02625 [Clostridiales bacterium]|nr:hypothetical protein [Clostridiales bacterium]
MVRFVIYADSEEDTKSLIPLLREEARKRGKWALIQPYVGQEALPRYLSFVKRNPYLVMVVATRGSNGRTIATKIRENNPLARMLWFSDPDNCVYSYRIHVTCFGLLPPTEEGVALALDACELSSEKPPTDSQGKKRNVPSTHE